MCVLPLGIRSDGEDFRALWGAAVVYADTLDSLQVAIKAQFPDETGNAPSHRLIVQTKDANNELHPLEKNPKLKLFERLVCDEEGKYDVYVKVAPKPVYVEPEMLPKAGFCVFPIVSFIRRLEEPKILFIIRDETRPRP